MRLVKILGRAAAGGTIVLCGVGANRASPAPRAAPPSSLAPEASSATLRPRHAHRVVVACTARRTGPTLRCDETLAAGDARTELSLAPLQSRSVVRGADRRQRLEFALGADGRLASGADTLDVPTGNWELVWPGYKSRETLRLEAGMIVSLRLESKTGRCEPREQATCSLLHELSRTLIISDR
jgi:hypothetical protein